MKKLCCIFNIPSLYREAIYLSIDKAYDCEWFFENEQTDIALFDTSQLKSRHLLEHKQLCGRLYRMQGLTKSVLLGRMNDAYLIVGAPMCLSIWVLCLLSRVFRPHCKIYFWTHGWYGKETKAERIIKKAFLKLADGLFLYGNYAKSLLVKEGFDEKRLHVIHNSLSYEVQLALRQKIAPSDVYRAHFGSSSPVLLFIGRLTAVKKLDLVLDAVALLKKKGQRYHVVLVGDGEKKDYLSQKVHELGIDDQVWFYGPCYDEQVNAELIFNADLCVSPGNIGLTAIHVLMFGCPAITHKDFAHQMPEFEAIKPFKTGNFFERGDIASLVKTIEEWFRVNGNLREYVRDSCFDEIDNFWTPSFQMKVLHQVIG